MTNKKKNFEVILVHTYIITTPDFQILHEKHKQSQISSDCIKSSQFLRSKKGKKKEEYKQIILKYKF